jgi:hypothetical protein
MNKTFIIIGFVFVSACEAQPKKSNITEASVECNFSFENLDQCVYKSQLYEVTVNVASENIADDEKLITSLSVKTNNLHQVLTISHDTTILDGDLGYISFSDINFDGVPDLAITTSFGAPNLYLDYWVFNVQQEKYVSVGNYPQLIINEQKKTLKTTVKNNAENYRTKEWHWRQDKLEKIN